MVIAIVPDVQENYVNVKRLWMEAGIDMLERKITIATDLKLCNILIGLMSHSSCHACCWCHIKKDDLRNNGVLRTIKSLMDLFWSFFEERVDRDAAKDYGNVIHPAMFASGNVDEIMLILLLLPPPELHLLIGPVNTIYDAMNKVWPGSEVWLKKVNVKREEYHGVQR